MVPNKLENQIKEKLNTREIQPSAQAWDRLDAMLTIAEEKKTKRPFGFLSRNFGIAASILVLLTVGLFFFTQKSTNIEPQNNVVNTKTKKDTIQNSINKIQLPIITKKQQEVIVFSEEKPTTHNSQPTTNNKSIINQKSNENQIIKDKVIEFQNPTDIALKDLPRIQTEKEIVFVSNKNVKSDEALLAELESATKISTGQKSAIKIDAKSLLSQVDGELEQTFREKVITKISKNYKSVKVALANRNNQ